MKETRCRDATVYEKCYRLIFIQNNKLKGYWPTNITVPYSKTFLL